MCVICIPVQALRLHVPSCSGKRGWGVMDMTTEFHSNVIMPDYVAFFIPGSLEARTVPRK